jgi:hypothetical protein
MFQSHLFETPINRIPNKQHLIPMYPHRAHKLHETWLLHEEALLAEQTFICKECKRKLERPALALSNSMWIGRVPFELKILTLPEKLLVAL